MTDDGIEHIQIAVADYQPHPRNYNEHPDPQVGEIAESLRLFGQVKPVVVWREWYIAGHGVVLGARRLGWTELKAERLPADWPEYKALAYLAADNELARGASPNLVALAGLAKEIQAEDRDLGRLAAGGEEGLRRLAELVKEPAGEDVGPQIDRAEELREVWGVEAGQLWRLGEHRLVCGDCTDAGVVARVMGGERVALCVTSPPYAEQRADKYASVSAEEYVGWFDAVCDGVLRSLLDNGNFVLNIKAHTDDMRLSTYVMELICKLARTRFILRDEFVWIHGGTPGSPNVMNKLKNQYEPIFWLSPSVPSLFYPDAVKIESESAVLVSPKNPGLERLQGTRHADLLAGGVKGKGLAYPGNVLRFPRGDGDVEEIGNHPAAFSVKLVDFFVRLFAVAGDLVLDPFLGSGTTLIACERLGRRCRAVEISPAYCAVAIQRWVDMTGGVPALLSAGDTPMPSQNPHAV